MGGVFSDDSSSQAVVRPYAAYLTQDEEAVLGTVFAEGNVLARLNDARIVLVDEERDLKSLACFKEFVIRLLRTSHKDTTTIVWDAIKDKGENGEQYFTLLMQCASSSGDALSPSSSSSPPPPLPVNADAEKMARFLGLIKRRSVTSTILRLCDDFFPHHESLLKTHFMQRLSIPPSQSFIAFDPPDLDGKSAIVTREAMLPLALHSKLCQGEWVRLYSTNEDGYDFENLRNNIVGYDGGTVVIIKTTKGDVFGSFNACTWREGGDAFFGSSKSFLFTIAPELRVYRSNHNAEDTQQYLNMRGYAREQHGLGLGRGSSNGSSNNISNNGTGLDHRIFIPRSMSDCYAAPSCNTFEAGPLLGTSASSGSGELDMMKTSSSYFDIDVMEVWGSGGRDVIDGALAGLEDKRAQKQRVQERARKVDRAAFFNNEFDQEMFLGNTFAHRKQVQNQ